MSTFKRLVSTAVCAAALPCLGLGQAPENKTAKAVPAEKRSAAPDPAAYEKVGRIEKWCRTFLTVVLEKQPIKSCSYAVAIYPRDAISMKRWASRTMRTLLKSTYERGSAGIISYSSDSSSSS